MQKINQKNHHEFIEGIRSKRDELLYSMGKNDSNLYLTFKEKILIILMTLSIKMLK